MRKKNSKLGIFLLVCALGFIALSMVVVLTQPRLLQYVVPAASIALDVTDDDGNVQTQLKAARQAMETEEMKTALTGGTAAYTLSGHAVDASVKVDADNGNSAATGLVAAGERYFAVYDKVPLLGRLLNSDELEQGDRVMLLDEQLAIALFQMADVIDRKVLLNGESYRVVGVLRHGKQVGDDADYYAYVPYRALEKDTGLQLEALMLTAVPQPKGGAMASFKEITQAWQPGGAAYDLGKEKVGAWIWARYLACGLGFAIWGLLVGAYVRSVQRLGARLRERLETSYMGRLLPWFLFQVLLRILALALLAVMAGGLMLFLLDPVNYYPEYVPQVLVEPKEIQIRFWALRAAEARRVVYQSAEIIRLTYFASVIKSTVVVFLAGLALCFFRRRQSKSI